MSYKLIKINYLKYILLLTGVILFILIGCSKSNLDKIDVNSIKEKTKDIKKEDLENLKKKIKIPTIIPAKSFFI